MRNGVKKGVRSEVADRIRLFRKERKLSQVTLAQRLGSSQSAINRWETGIDKPAAKALLKISEDVPEGERQWWRDRAAEQAGIAAFGPESLETITVTPLAYTIPLISNPQKIGDMGPILPSDVESHISLPADWFSEGGVIQAVRIKDFPESQFLGGELVALIDIAQRDGERLVGSMVAVQTRRGIDFRWVSKDGSRLILIAKIEPSKGFNVETLRKRGENSILGKVMRIISQPSRS